MLPARLGMWLDGRLLCSCEPMLAGSLAPTLLSPVASLLYLGPAGLRLVLVLGLSLESALVGGRRPHQVLLGRCSVRVLLLVVLVPKVRDRLLPLVSRLAEMRAGCLGYWALFRVQGGLRYTLAFPMSVNSLC